MSSLGLGLLPTEPLLNIFRYLHYKDLIRLSCLNQRFWQLTADDSLWRWQCQHYFLENCCDKDISWKHCFIRFHRAFGRYPDYCQIKHAWNQIEDYLQKNLPGLLPSLLDPATEEDINSVETELGVTFPLDFRLSLRIHNGQKLHSTGILGSGARLLGSDILLSLQDIKVLTMSQFRAHCMFTGGIPVSYCRQTRSILLMVVEDESGLNKGYVYDFSYSTGDEERNWFIYGNSFKDWFCTYANNLHKGRYISNGQEILRFYWDPSCLEETHGIKVTVATCFMPDISLPADVVDFVTAYRITMEMSREEDNSKSCQLETRHWIITDGNGDIERVDGPGVVGEFPIMQPGNSYSWVSSCSFTTKSGSMEGYFTMRNLMTGAMMEVKCPKFTMIAPDYLSLSEIIKQRRQIQLLDDTDESDDEG